MAEKKPLKTSIYFDDLDSTFHILADRQYSREDAMKIIAMYIMEHPEAKTARGKEYNVGVWNEPGS